MNVFPSQATEPHLGNDEPDRDVEMTDVRAHFHGPTTSRIAELYDSIVEYTPAEIARDRELEVKHKALHSRHFIACIEATERQAFLCPTYNWANYRKEFGRN